ncbi:hypothetical protein BDC45DRAFT_537466 [Circinella umbellata]|nr:hypothetical protein BDC45DRAFT_537466 [Circinella umbellata]
MNRSRFFQENEELSFASYLAQTHSTYDKTKLSALKSAYERMLRGQKSKLGGMKTNFSDEELQNLASDDSRSNNSNNSTNIGRDGGTATTNNTTIGAMNVRGVTLNIGSSHQEHTQEQLLPRKRDIDTEVPQPLPKRQRAKAMHIDFTDSGTLIDSDDFEEPSSQLFNTSSFTPSDLKSTPAGYIWEFNTCELKKKDIPQSPSTPWETFGTFGTFGK